MNRHCSCGGRLFPENGTRFVARFVCQSCGTVRTQRKRLPKGVPRSWSSRAEIDAYYGEKQRALIVRHHDELSRLDDDYKDAIISYLQTNKSK